MLELNIEYRDRMIHLKVPDNQSIQVIPCQITTAIPFKLDVCQQKNKYCCLFLKDKKKTRKNVFSKY